MMKTKKNLLYLVGSFPVLSETFILKEVLELSRDRSLNLRIISLRKGDESILLPPELKAKVSYFIKPRFQLLVSNVPAFFRNPVKYLGLIRVILFGRHSPLYLKSVDLNALLIGGALSAEIRNLDVDHIHAPWATWPTTVALVLSQLRGVPFSFTAHAHDIYKRQMLLEEKISLAKSVTTISKFNQNYLRSLASPSDRSKISLVYLGVDFKNLRFPAKKKAHKVPTILAVGRLVPKKGFSYLIEALYLVKKQHGRFKAFIVGGGPEFVTLKRMVKEKGLERDISLLGALPFEEVAKYLSNADIFVAPSVTASDGNIDGIPVVLFEAMSAKLPIVSTYVSGIPEAVEDGENGLLVEERDTEALAEAIHTLLANQELRRKFGKDGRNKALKMFDIQKNVQRLRQVILGEYNRE